jgi:FkbM family methyltransferase
MGKWKREILSVINGVIPQSVVYENYGRTWRIPNVPDSMERLMRPGRDALTGKWVNGLVPNADLIIDIGANVGQSLMLFKSVYPDAQYIGLEPNPVCSAVVCRLIALNGLEDCRIYTTGIGPSLSTGELLISRGHMDDPRATLVADYRPGAAACRSLPIISMRLQDLVPGLALSSQTIIKIDVEGYEADVLESLGDLVGQRPVIITEVLPERAGDNPAGDLVITRMHDWVARNNYVIVAIGQGAVEHIHRSCEAYILMPSELDRSFSATLSA